MYNCDPYNVLLSIATNIAVLLMTVRAPGTRMNKPLHKTQVSAAEEEKPTHLMKTASEDMCYD